MKQMLFSVLEYGAVADGKTDNTRAIQNAIDACHANGGGTVYFPVGEYVSTALTLKSYVTMELDVGAVLLAKALPGENTFMRGEHVEYVTIKGRGTIDCRLIPKRGDVFTLVLRNSRHLRMEQVQVLNSSNWCLTFNGCSHVKLLGINVIDSRKDSIDLVCCQNVQIDGVYITGSKDDNICIKNESDDHTWEKRPDCGFLSENIVISNTVIENTSHPAFKIGTGSAGIFRDIIVHDCVFKNFHAICCVQLMRPTMPETPDRVIENLLMSNIFAKNCDYLIDVTQIDVDHTIIKNLFVENVRVDRLKDTSQVIGYEGAPIENITLKGIYVTGQALAEDQPLFRAEYVNGLTISDWHVEGQYTPIFALTNCRRSQVNQLTSFQEAPLVQIAGAETEHIGLNLGCMMSCKEAVMVLPEVKANAVTPAVFQAECSLVQAPASILAGESMTGILRVENKGTDGFFSQAITANGLPIGVVSSWIPGGAKKEITFTTQPIFVPGKYQLIIADCSCEMNVETTPGKLWVNPMIEVQKEDVGYAFILQIQNIGGTALADHLELTNAGETLDNATFELSPGEEKEICLCTRQPFAAGDCYQIPGYVSWKYELAANTKARYQVKGTEWTITAAGLLHSVTGNLEYRNIFEYGAIYQKARGDFAVTARIMSQDFTGQYASVGILIANDVHTATGQKGLTVLTMVPKYGGFSIWRADEDGDGETEKIFIGLPAGYGSYFRIVKRGRDFQAYFSEDKKTWIKDARVMHVEAANDIQDVAAFTYANSVKNAMCKGVISDFTVQPWTAADEAALEAASKPDNNAAKI